MQNQSQTRPSREQKREQFVGEKKSKSKTAFIVVAIVVVIAGVAAYFVLNSSDKPAATTVTSSAPNDKTAAPSSPSAVSSQPSAQAQDSAVRIPIADLNDKAKFFQYPLSDGRVVRFFAVKSADGAYRTALDACDMCYHAKKGYRQEGSDMICNNCNLPFAVSRIGAVAGGCNPVGLPNKSEGNQLVINARELESRAGYF